LPGSVVYIPFTPNDATVRAAAPPGTSPRRAEAGWPSPQAKPLPPTGDADAARPASARLTLSQEKKMSQTETSFPARLVLVTEDWFCARG
jgi:hypothetical protein